MGFKRINLFHYYNVKFEGVNAKKILVVFNKEAHSHFSYLPFVILSLLHTTSENRKLHQLPEIRKVGILVILLPDF